MVELIPMEGVTAPVITLSPTQRKAAEEILLALERGDCAVLRDSASDGKTTVLNYIHQKLGGVRIGIREFLTQLAAHDPRAIEEAFLATIDTELSRHDLVLVDDLNLILDVVGACNYRRENLFDAALTAVLDSARASRKKLLFTLSSLPDPLSNRAFSTGIADLTAEDFAAICGAYLDEDVKVRLDFAEIFRFTPNINAHQLRQAAIWLSHEPNLDTENFCA